MYAAWRLNEPKVESLTRDVCTLSLSVQSHQGGHILKCVSTAAGTSHDFIIDTGSIESISSQSDLSQFYPKAVLLPTNSSIRGITGHSLPLVGSCVILIQPETDPIVQGKFLVSKVGPSVIGLKKLKALQISLSLSTSLSFKSELEDLIVKWSRVTGGMKVPKV